MRGAPKRLERQLRELALFAGAGGGILGGVLLGWRTVCAVEINAYCARRLMQRQNEGHLPPFPIWDDVCSFDGRPWRGVVDVVSGGFPCQDISVAGKGAGISGERSGLWGQMARIIREVQPRYAFVENSPALTVRGLGTVLGDLAEMGFDARWGVLGAIHVGAPHRRERIWIMADACGGRCCVQERRKEKQQGRAEIECGSKDVSNANSERIRQLPGWVCGEGRSAEQAEPANDGAQGIVAHSKLHGRNETKKQGSVKSCVEEGWMLESKGQAPRGYEWWATEPDVGRVANGVAHRVDRLRAIGNGQVPAVVAGAWETLTRARLA